MLAPDFSLLSSDVGTLFVLEVTKLRDAITHIENPDIVFVLNTNFYVGQISTRIVKKGPDEAPLTQAKALKGTNFVYTGGWSGRMLRYDYTSDPLVHEARHVYSVGFRCVSLLDNSQHSPREIAWGVDSNQYLWFFDRTGDLSSTTRKTILVPPPSLRNCINL